MISTFNYCRQGLGVFVSFCIGASSSVCRGLNFSSITRFTTNLCLVFGLTRNGNWLMVWGIFTSYKPKIICSLLGKKKDYICNRCTEPLDEGYRVFVHHFNVLIRFGDSSTHGEFPLKGEEHTRKNIDDVYHVLNGQM